MRQARGAVARLEQDFVKGFARFGAAFDAGEHFARLFKRPGVAIQGKVADVAAGYFRGHGDSCLSDWKGRES